MGGRQLREVEQQNIKFHYGFQNFFNNNKVKNVLRRYSITKQKIYIKNESISHYKNIIIHILPWQKKIANYTFMFGVIRGENFSTTQQQYKDFFTFVSVVLCFEYELPLLASSVYLFIKIYFKISFSNVLTIWRSKKFVLIIIRIFVSWKEDTFSRIDPCYTPVLDCCCVLYH